MVGAIFKWKSLHLRFVHPKRPRKTYSPLPPSSPDHAGSSLTYANTSDQVEAYSSDTFPQEDHISAFTEDEASLNQSSPLVDPIQASGGEVEDGAQKPLEGEMAGEPVIKEEELEEWPLTSSFYRALGKTMDEIEAVPEAPQVDTADLVPPSIPEEQELKVPSPSQAAHPSPPEGQTAKDEEQSEDGG